jgi:Fic family protein
MFDNVFTPNFSMTDQIRLVIDEIERQRWLIDNMLLMPKHEAWIRRDVSIRRAAGTTQIEGASLDEGAVADLSRKNPVGKLTQDEQANINAIQAYEFIDFLSDQADIPIDELVVRQINREILRGAAQTLTPGAYRNGQNTVGQYRPPNQGDVPSLMRAFALWLRQEDDIEPIVRAAIAHIHLVAIHPFWDGNGRTARGLAALVLQRSPFGFRKLLSLESVLFVNRDRYFSELEQTLGARLEPDYDATSWIEFFATTLLTNAVQLSGRLADWHRQMSEVYGEFEGLDLNSRQADGFAYTLQAGRITRADYIEVTRASAITASRDLAGLVKAGLLLPEGRTRARVYRPSMDTTEKRARSAPESIRVLREERAPPYGDPAWSGDRRP